MVISGVKRKVPVTFGLVLLAVATGVLSWARVFPPSFVENVYSRRVFPTISHIAGRISDSVPFSWIDAGILIGVFVVVFSIRRRNWRLPLGLVCALYLLFFWGWGLNYHRPPVDARMGLDHLPEPSRDEFMQFSTETTLAVNRLWRVSAGQVPSRGHGGAMEREAVARVRQVIAQIDGTDWEAATWIKHSYPADVWFHAAGIDGVFNPVPHEPILVGGIPNFQLPFLMAHELAHGHGIANEGDANFVAFLATIGSEDPQFRYSAAFEMWLHLGSKADVLDPGPRQDLQVMWDRIQAQEIPQVSRFQSALLNTHLKANGVPEGVKSYSKFVTLAMATRSRWGDYR